MIDYAVPFLFAIFIWWFSTGLVFMANKRGPETRSWILWGVTALLAVSLIGVWVTRDQPSVYGAYLAFLSGLGLWAWNEVTFLLGLLTGPVTKPCPANAKGWSRFRLAAGTVLHHEIAILLCGLVLALLTWGAENQVALYTYGILWGMRLSAKLNIFFGVSRFASDMLPTDLAYLSSYFGKRTISPFFGVSVTLGTVLVAFVFHAASGSAFQITAAMLSGTLMALALLEHWLLILPIQDAALWNWATRPDQDPVSKAQNDPASAVEIR